MIKGAEVESLKVRLSQYADYDEVKRELDIMKVSVHFASCGQEFKPFLW